MQVERHTGPRLCRQQCSAVDVVRCGEAPEEVSHSRLAGANVLVEHLRALHTDQAHPCSRHCSRYDVGLAAAWRAVQQHSRTQPQRSPAPGQGADTPVIPCKLHPDCCCGHSHVGSGCDPPVYGGTSGKQTQQMTHIGSMTAQTCSCCILQQA